MPPTRTRCRSWTSRPSASCTSCRTARIPSSSPSTPDDRHLYIANEDDAIATVVHIESRTVVAQIDVGVEPEGMAVSQDGRYAIVTSETSSMAHWIDPATQSVVADTLVDQRPRDA